MTSGVDTDELRRLADNLGGADLTVDRALRTAADSLDAAHERLAKVRKIRDEIETDRKLNRRLKGIPLDVDADDLVADLDAALDGTR